MFEILKKIIRFAMVWHTSTDIMATLCVIRQERSI